MALASGKAAEVPPKYLRRLEDTKLSYQSILWRSGWLEYPFNFVALVRYLFSLARALRRWPADIVVFHGAGNSVINSVAAQLGSPGARCVVVVRDQLSPKPLTMSRTLVRKVAAKLVDRFVAVSESVGDSLRRQAFVPAGRLSVIYNGWDFSDFRCEAERAIRTEEFSIVCVARLDHKKDHETILKAMKLLQEAGYVNIRLRLVGDGPTRPRLEALTQELQLGERVSFLGVRDDVPDLLRQAHLFVLCTEREGLPGAVAEAMASGVPVIATDIGPLRELIEDRRTGLLVPPRNVQALADRIMWTIEHPEKARRMAQAARQSVKRYSIEATVTGYEELFRKIAPDLNKRARPRNTL